ncbi:hypothetical protein [Methanosphaera sp. BMS]|uniref:hypothetical protein n=1 Tax=Methanosphaera sp. BMS TaxID=1789762 RepID=UPI000DC1C482|nr:hypothetical protein [Methanosphaera sp. BMS]AWX31801.1 hypothetical protein AW729_01275 [Methanosphaera sp. BMS]
MRLTMQNNAIFADTDCLSCFIMINRTDILQELFEYITIPSYVYEEFLQAPYDIKKEVNLLIEKNSLK